MNNKRKGNFLQFILPYVLIIGIIVTVLIMFNGYSSTSVESWSQGDIVTIYKDEEYTSEELETNLNKSKLWTSNITALNVTSKPASNLISLSGYYSNGDKKVGFTASLSYENSIYCVDYIINNRTTTDENGYVIRYYNPNVLVYSDPYASNFWSDYFPTILISGISILLVFFVFTRMTSSINKSNNSAMDFNRSRARREDASNVKFDDVAGCDECKAEMVELVDYLRQPQKYSKFGAKLPHGVLLVGPPGTGKTLLAKAVAGEAKVPFYSISGSDFVEMFVGVGAGRVRDMFKKAKQTAPCLIFIDEIDAVGRQRGTGMGGGNDEREQTLNQLLVEMDGFQDNAGIIVIAATNRDDVLDPALLRAGRFDRKITVDMPDRLGREQILKVHAKNKIIDKSVDFAAIAKRTVGFSGADLANVLNEAAILAVRENKECVTIQDIDEAIDRRISGPAKANQMMSDRERRMIAFHEAGHAIIGMKVPHSDKVQKVTIVARGRTGGHVLMTPEEDRFLMTKSELEARIVGYLGGRASEEVFFGDVGTGASNDIEMATKIARAMVTQYGMSPLGPIQYESDQGSVFLGRDYTNSTKNFSSQVANEIDAEIRRIIETSHKMAVDTVTEWKDKVTLIAETLLDKETITAEEIEYLMDHDSLEGLNPKPAAPEEAKPEVSEETKPETQEETSPESEDTPTDTSETK